MADSVDTSKTREIAPNRTRLLLSLAGCIAFVVLGLWMISGDFSDTRRGMWAPLAGWAAIACFGGLALLIAWRLIRPFPLTFSPAGITPSPRVGLVPWSAVTAIGEQNVGSQRFVRLELDPAANGRRHLNLGAQSFQISADELLQLTLAYAAAHSGRSEAIDA